MSVRDTLETPDLPDTVEIMRIRTLMIAEGPCWKNVQKI